MLLPNWEQLPKELQTSEGKPYYDILRKKQGSLFFKRLFDILVSCLMLILLSPLCLILGILIKCDSKGPILFRQVRVTQFGKQFRIFKFRTMVPEASNLGAQVTMRGDTRVTRIGKTLRRFRLDELPQLLNVLCGQMSFVGVRPEVPRFVECYTGEMRATLLLPAGITSPASIAFREEDALLAGADDPDKVYRVEILPKKMELNLRYLREFGFFRDIAILFETVTSVFGRGREKDAGETSGVGGHPGSK